MTNIEDLEDLIKFKARPGRMWQREDIADILTSLALFQTPNSEWQQGYVDCLLRVALALGCTPSVE